MGFSRRVGTGREPFTVDVSLLETRCAFGQYPQRAASLQRAPSTGGRVKLQSRHFLATVRTGEIQSGSQRHDSSRVDLSVSDVVVPLNVIKVYRFGDSRLLIKVHQVALEIRVIQNPPDITFEMTVINRIEPNERAK